MQFTACNMLQFLCNNCRLFNVKENIHCCNILASWIISITLESLQLLHKNCSSLHAINCTWNHGITPYLRRLHNGSIWKIWYHPQNRKYTTLTARLAEENWVTTTDDPHIKFGEVWTWFPRYRLLADRHTNMLITIPRSFTSGGVKCRWSRSNSSTKRIARTYVLVC